LASITIRGLDDELKQRLRVRAARNGRSMEEEVRTILRRAVGGMSGPDLWALSQKLFGPDHGVELELPDRRETRAPPNFE
jgi:plasmid stability protein